MPNSDVLEQAIVVSFLDEPRLQRWLDRAGGLLADSGFLRIGLDLFIDGFPRTPGVLRVREMPGARAARPHSSTPPSSSRG